jgi:hypothetical protein
MGQVTITPEIWRNQQQWSRLFWIRMSC